MAGHVEFRHHADAACPRIGDHLAQLVLGVELAFGCDAGQPGKLFAFGAKTLIVAEMPVKDIELGGRHAIERAFDRGYRLKVAAHIEHEAAPAETRHIADGHGGQHAGALLHGSELQEGLEPVHSAQTGGRGQRGSLGSHAQLIALVFVDRLHRLTGPGDIDEQRGMRGSWMIDGGAQYFAAAGAAEPDQSPSDRGLEPGVMGLAVVVGECRGAASGGGDRKSPFTACDRAGQWHHSKRHLGRRRCLR